MKVSRISNLLARSFLVFIIAWLWVGFYVRGFFLILLISTAITLVVNYMISFIGKRRNTKRIATKQEREHMQQVILQLKFMTQTQTLALFKRALQPNARKAVNQKRFTLKTLFHLSTPTEQDIIKCIKASPTCASESEQSKTIITAESFPPHVIAFTRNLDANIILLDAEAVYTQILAPTQTFPEIKIQTKKKTPRKTLREIRTMAFNRTRTKSYVITGVIILFSSLIVRLHLYYIIFATIVFALALTSYFSPRAAVDLFDA